MARRRSGSPRRFADGWNDCFFDAMLLVAEKMQSLPDEIGRDVVEEGSNRWCRDARRQRAEVVSSR